jgi:type IV pilus assembly protein PilB
MKLGQILLHRRRIARDQLRAALQRQRDSGRPLGETLVAMGIVSRDDVVDALRLLPTGSVGRRTIEQVSAEITRALTPRLARQYRCVPVVLTPGALVVAMADPLDRRAVSAIAKHASLPVVPIAAPLDALDAAIDLHYPEETSALAPEPS